MAENNVVRFTTEKHVPLELAEAWEVFTNTDHFNRFVPLPRVTYAPVANATRALRQATAKLYGMKLSWTEYPFEWVESKRFSVRRVYDSGPVKVLVGGTEFEAVPGGGTRLTFFAEVEARSIFHRPILGFIVGKTLRAFREYVDTYLRLRETGSEHMLPSRQATTANHTRLDLALERLRARYSVKDSLISRFKTHIRDSGDDEVRRMRPYVLADFWREDRHATLEFFLYATKSGVTTLDWELMCPNCRVPKAEFSTFKAITSTYHCDLCGIDYSTDLDKYTELRFSIDPAFREAEDAIYCIGSPAKTPHVLAQSYLQPGETATVELVLPPGGLRIRVVGPNTDLRLEPTVAPGKAQSLSFKYEGDQWVGTAAAFAPGPATVTLRNDAGGPALCVVEKVQWDDRVVTAAAVTALQKFRDMFGSEVLAPGQQIGLRNLCVLFTDLKKSTELYELVGDASAFARVIRHFDYITEAVAKHRGALVKTIGDAVMAVFPSPLTAVQACIEMQAGLDEFNRRQNLDPPLILKMGVHYGSAIAVNANGVLDYFGRTVNFAARVQAESEGGDVVLSAAVAGAEGVTEWLREQPLDMSEYTVRLKGFEDAVKLWKVAPKAAARKTA